VRRSLHAFATAHGITVAADLASAPASCGERAAGELLNVI
jgi:hypothetical protein